MISAIASNCNSISKQWTPECYVVLYQQALDLYIRHKVHYWSNKHCCHLSSARLTVQNQLSGSTKNRGGVSLSPGDSIYGRSPWKNDGGRGKIKETDGEHINSSYRLEMWISINASVGLIYVGCHRNSDVFIDLNSRQYYTWLLTKIKYHQK